MKTEIWDSLEFIYMCKFELEQDPPVKFDLDMFQIQTQ